MFVVYCYNVIIESTADILRLCWGYTAVASYRWMYKKGIFVTLSKMNIKYDKKNNSYLARIEHPTYKHVIHNSTVKPGLISNCHYFSSPIGKHKVTWPLPYIGFNLRRALSRNQPNTEGVRYIDDWPSQSPDLNPIEHLGHHLKLRLSAYEQKAKGVHELWERVEKEWNSFTEDVCRSYIESMPARIKAVIDANGGHTRY